MGEEVEIQDGNIFIIGSDGRCIPFNGISEVQVTGSIVDHEENKVYAVLKSQSDTTYSTTIKLTHKQRRFWKRFFKREINKERRRYRHIKRLNEKARRRFLKAGYKVV